MKLKINKACDINSISVLPPQSRRSNVLSSGPQTQLRSQPSQQSFSQGPSSQPGMFSQFSQNSLDEVLTNDQKFGSQERENSVKRNALFPLSIGREDGQMLISRPSANAIRKWNPTSLSEHRCQVSEELERRVGMMETSLNRFGMILDSVQSDAMQINKGTKEALLEMEGIRQKLTAHDNLLQQLNKGLEDIKASLDRSLDSIPDLLRRETNQNKLLDLSLEVSALPQHMEAALMRLQRELTNTFTKDLQALVSSTKDLKKKDLAPFIPSPKGSGCLTSLQKKSQPIKNAPAPQKVCIQATADPKEETGGWKFVKAAKNASINSVPRMEQQQKVSPLYQERECRVIIDSDEELDAGFSCLLEERKTEDIGISFIEEVEEETERILRKARRRKRKHCNPIIIN